jgi:TP901 family phage tail tape measure protein
MKDLVLKILLSAKDEASSVFDRVRGSSGLLGQAWDALKSLLPALGFGLAVKSAGDFESALLRVKAANPQADMEALRAEASRLAGLPELAYSAEQAAQGFEVLARSGLNSVQSIGTLGSVMNLAQGQSMDLAHASGIVTNTLDQFGLTAKTAAEAQANSARVTDVLANTDVAQLGEALANINVQAKLNGTGLEQTTAALDVLAKNGVKGAEAGTYLSGVFEELNNPTSKLAQNLDGLGISVRDFPSVVKALYQSQ